jgi:hypothetical protein
VLPKLPAFFLPRPLMWLLAGYAAGLFTGLIILVIVSGH